MLNPYNIKIINGTTDFDYIKKVIEAIDDNTICLGITSMTGYQIKDGLKVAKRVKKKFPKLPIIWGGYHPTILPRVTVEDPNIDIVVKGQGEVTFKDVIDRLATGSSLQNVPNIVFKDPKGKIFETKFRKMEDLNIFPKIPLDIMDLSPYITSTKWGPTIDFYTSQGLSSCHDFRHK